MRHLLLLAPLIFGTALAQPTAQRFEFNRIVSAYQRADRFMGNVAITVDGEEIYSRSVGFANLEQPAPNRVNTVFEVGSITKSFTGVAILKLQEQGKLRVTDPLSKFLPDFPNAANVTVHQLLTHSSGIARVTALPNFIELQKQDLSTDRVIDIFKNLPPSFRPGERYSYNNSGYILLGKIIEVVSGQTYSEYLQKNVLDMLNYTASKPYSSLDVIPARASGYALDGAEFQLPEPHNVEVSGAAGQLFATSRELVRWLPDVLGGKVLSTESVKQFTAPQIETKSPAEENKFYGYGVDVGTLFGRDVISHGGNINGFNSMMFYFPKEKMSIVALSNTEGTSSLALTMDLIRAYFDQPYTLRKAKPVVSVPEALLQTYTGVYVLEGTPLSLKVELGGGQLTVALPGQGTYKLLPYNQNSFLLNALGGEVTFKLGSAGPELILTAGPQTLTAKKQP